MLTLCIGVVGRRFQVNCLSVDIVTIYMLRNANNAVVFSFILSNSPIFGTALFLCKRTVPPSGSEQC